MNFLILLFFSVAWCVAIYLFNSFIARRYIQIEIRPMMTYVLTMASLGLFGEVAYGVLYSTAFGEPLWQYHLLPIHSAYTSLYSLFLWGMVGFHLYLLHGTLGKWGVTSKHTLAFLFCIEAIILEALVNLSYVAVFSDYLYYYLPNDLWHITSTQTLPLYLLAGYIAVSAFSLATKLPRYALAGNTTVIALLLVLQ